MLAGQSSLTASLPMRRIRMRRGTGLSRDVGRGLIEMVGIHFLLGE